MTTPPERELNPPDLPAPARLLFDQLFSGQFLGASRNIRQINDLFCAIAEAWTTSSAKDLFATLRATGDYIAATRGRNTPAIGNAIQLFLRELAPVPDESIDTLRRRIYARRSTQNAQSLRNVDLIAEHGANLLSGCEVLLVFDYSSSQVAILLKLAERGRKLRLVVPESRCLDGGRPIVSEATACGHSVDFVVDFAFAHFLRQTDAVLCGAETVLANGDCWNTVGSYAIAEVAALYRIPVYIATELIKIDPRSFTGVRKSIKPVDYSRILVGSKPFDHPELVSCVAPDLDNVPAPLISAYITPQGVMPPTQMWHEAKSFFRSIGIPTASEETAE